MPANYARPCQFLGQGSFCEFAIRVVFLTQSLINNDAVIKKQRTDHQRIVDVTIDQC
jgi:hypothetical protein